MTKGGVKAKWCMCKPSKVCCVLNLCNDNDKIHLFEIIFKVTIFLKITPNVIMHFPNNYIPPMYQSSENSPILPCCILFCPANCNIKLIVLSSLEKVNKKIKH